MHSRWHQQQGCRQHVQRLSAAHHHYQQQQQQYLAAVDLAISVTVLAAAAAVAAAAVLVPCWKICYLEIPCFASCSHISVSPHYSTVQPSAA
jgi:hypothetical protein